MIPTGIIPPESGVPDARTQRAFRRTSSARWFSSVPAHEMSAFRHSALYCAGMLSQLRRFGLNSEAERQYFSTMTGRSRVEAFYNWRHRLGVKLLDFGEP